MCVEECRSKIDANWFIWTHAAPLQIRTCDFLDCVRSALWIRGQFINNRFQFSVDLRILESHQLHDNKSVLIELVSPFVVCRFEHTFAVSLWNTCSAANRVCKLVTKNNIRESCNAGNSSCSSVFKISYVRRASSSWSRPFVTYAMAEKRKKFEDLIRVLLKAEFIDLTFTSSLRLAELACKFWNECRWPS